MSHIVQIQTEVRDAAAIGAACRRLGLAEPVYGEARLFSGAKTGWQVKLAGWRYSIVCNVADGTIDYDNYGGHWGERQELDRFLQTYAVEMTKIAARKKGYTATEQQLPNGSIKVTVNVGGAA